MGNLPRYFNGRERVGVSLTGGLDTRIIMAWRKAEPNTLPCYTFSSMYRDTEDVKLARRVAKICGQRHELIPTGEEFLSRFAHYAERTIYLTDGCVDLSRSPDLYVNEKVREIAPVRMVGTYGSEILLHAVMFKAELPVAGLFQPEFESQIRAAKQTYDASRQVHPVTFVAFRQSPWHHYGVLDWSRPRWRCGRLIWTMIWSKRCTELPSPLESMRKRGSGLSETGIQRWLVCAPIGQSATCLPGEFSSSYSRRNMPTTWVCRSGLRE